MITSVADPDIVPVSSTPKTVNVVVSRVTVGVPDMTPVVVLNVNPDGKAGLMLQEATGVPVFVGLICGMGISFIRICGVGYEKKSGSKTLILIVAVPNPTSFVAVTVNVIVENEIVGIPDISPVVELNVNPAGKAGLILHDEEYPSVIIGLME